VQIELAKTVSAPPADVFAGSSGDRATALPPRWLTMLKADFIYIALPMSREQPMIESYAGENSALGGDSGLT
jgi:hypothetical protein